MIDDAIYSASPEIACRRYNPSLGIVLTAGSIALLWANSHVSLFTENDMLSQWNLLISSCILCTGIAGGALGPLIVGGLGDLFGLRAALCFLFLTLGYILSIAFWVRPLVVNKRIRLRELLRKER